MALLAVPHNLSINFLKYRWAPVIMIALTVVVTFLALFSKGLNYGIDFKGGLQIEVKTSRDLQSLRKDLARAVTKEVTIQEIGKGKGDFLIRTEVDEASDSEKKAERKGERVVEGDLEKNPTVLKIKNVLGPKTEYRNIQSIGPKMGKELIDSGIKGILLSLLAIAAYVAFRFEWQFGVCGVLALLHDCVGIVGYFALTQCEFTEQAVVAVLITASYSINDTVVIYDRVRENRVYRKGSSVLDILNRSINETLPRTLLTSATTLLALLVLYLFGGKIISDFSMPILVGISIGTLSSIFISVPLLVFFPSAITKSRGIRSTTST